VKRGWVSFVNFRYMNDDKQTGDLNFDQQRDKGLLIFWGSEINTDRLDIICY
jgi:hypothetical protein